MKKHNHYSLDALDEWIQDCLNSDAEPEEIYDAIVTAIDDNIRYHVEPLLSIHHLCDMFATHIRTSRKDFSKTLVFYQTIADCSQMYRTLRRMLGEEFTEPRGFPDFHKYRLWICTPGHHLMI